MDTWYYESLLTKLEFSSKIDLLSRAKNKINLVYKAPIQGDDPHKLRLQTFGILNIQRSTPK